MWESIWMNGHIATMADENGYGIIEDGVIAVKQGKIAWVGSKDKCESFKAENHFDLGGKWVTPGLIDPHTHLVYGGNRAHEFELRLQGASYEDIAKAGGGILSTVKATRAADEAELLRQATPRIKALIAEGICGLEIKSGYGLDLESEAKMLRVASEIAARTGLKIQRTFLGAHAIPPEYKNRADDYINLICDEMLPQLHQEGLIDAVDGFCENIGFSRAQIQRVFDTAKALGLPIKLHAEQLSNQNGATLAAEYGALSADHLEYLDEAGVKAMAKASTCAVLLPGAYYFLRETKLPPIALLREHRVPIALASDLNPGSSPVNSLLLIMNMACTLFKMTPEEALAGITRNAAKALGWADYGTIEAGKCAHFVLWDIERPAELTYNVGLNPCSGIVHSGVIDRF